jgi:hypothetical protein
LAAAFLVAALLAGVARAQPIEFPAPRSATFEEILMNLERNITTFRFARQQRVLIIDFPKLSQQGAAFNRVSAFIERQRAPHDRVLSEQEFETYLQSVGKTQETLSYGNNFTIGNLVVFFNLADDRGVPLNEYERAVLGLLTRLQLVVKRTGFYQAKDPDAVVLSVPQVGAAPAGTQDVTLSIRTSILSHELSHAEFYTNGLYAEFCRYFWRQVLNDEQRKGFRDFFERSTYDANLEDVVINEWQAYFVHTNERAAFRGSLVGIPEEELERLRGEFKKQSAAAGVVLGLM